MVTDASISDMVPLHPTPGESKSELKLYRNSMDISLGNISGLVPNAVLPSKASTCHGNNEVDNQL
jgi:hypothetical protein